MNLNYRFITIFLTFSIFISGCAPMAQQAPSSIDLETTNQVSTETQLPADIPTLPASITPLPPITIPFYLLRIEYSSTSDWATLEFQNPDGILATRVISITGSPTTSEATSESLQLLRPLEALKTEPSVAMTVDLAIDPAVIQEPLVVLSRHGGIGGSGIRFFYINDLEELPLMDIDHYWADPSNPGYNDTSFEIDLFSVEETRPINRQLISIAPQKMLWAFYYPWIAWDQNASCTDHPLSAYDYNIDGSRTFETFSIQIEQAQNAGIDGFIVSWLDDETINRNLILLLDAAEEKGFYIAIYLESTPDPKDRTVHPDTITKWLEYGIPAFGGHPAYMQVNGKPLIVVYNSSAAPLETWQTILNRLDSEDYHASYMGMSFNLDDLSLFVGLHQYAIIGMPDLSFIYQTVSRGVRYYSLLQDTPSQQKIFAATVQPGFDDCPYHPPTTDLLEERKNGDYYRSTFEAAIQSDPDWIFITSWNEFGETTHIEPSEFYGTQYLEITREYAEMWKNQ